MSGEASKHTREAKKKLHAAWDEMIQNFESARNGIDHADLMPATQNERNLAEGYRYVVGHMHAALERAFHSDVTQPQFRNALSILTRSTIDNADAIYFYAPIDGRASYILRGEAGDARHWKGDAPAPTGRRAPHYMIFETTWGVLPGDSGELSELRPGIKTQTGRLDSSKIEVDSDGSFEILLAPERPEGHTGNFISTLKVVQHPHPTDPTLPPERYAQFLSGRQLFNDWDREDAVYFDMVQVGAEGTVSDAYTPERALEELRECGKIVKNQMHFWNAFWTIPMGSYGEREGSIPGVCFPRNGFNTMNAASGATGGGMSTNLYAGGIAELAPDEAFIIENHIRLQPQYIGFQLGNLWGESLEYANRVGSRNGHQSRVDDDGVIRLVVSHEDPGVPNWLDTSGHPEVFMSPRWAYSQTPEPSDWPTITGKKVKLSEVREHLPTNTPAYSPEERRTEIAIRQRRVRKRFRMF